MRADNYSSQDNKKSVGKAVLYWVIEIAVAVVIALLIIQVIRPTVVKETSMLPNFRDGNYLFVYRLAYKGDKTPQKGDVIIFKSKLTTDSGKPKMLIKRVIGLPGDKITIQDGKVWINGKEDSQSYTHDGETNGSVVNYTVPKNHYYCMGDNRLVSIDSRYASVGAIDKSKIVGKVVFRLYPFNKMGTIKNPYKSN